MEWCFDTGTPGARAAVEVEVVEHLRRHALDELTLTAARPAVARALDDAEGAGGWWLVSLDWEDPTPRLRLRRGPGILPFELVADGPAPGVGRVHDRMHRHAGLAAAAPGPGLDLAVLRAPEPDMDPQPVDVTLRVTPDTWRGEVLSLLASAAASGHGPGAAAAVAGASLGRAFEASYRAEKGVAGPMDAARVAEAFVEMQRRAGADFFVVAADGRRAELGNRRCPLGPTVARAPELCRCTSAALGQMAARSGGAARVSMPERLATGDAQCRVILEMEGPGDSGPAPVAHRYTWPPAGMEEPTGPAPVAEDAGEEQQGFRVDLSLQLPRDRLSVPVVRHLTQHALEEVGVVGDDRADVELALTEACANVLDHSGQGDAYDVTVSVGLESCEIRVVDIGRGFDYASLEAREAHPEAESGRGISLMHALMDQVRFTSAPEKGTIVHLVKRLHFDEQAPARRLLLNLLDQSRRGGAPGSR